MRQSVHSPTLLRCIAAFVVTLLGAVAAHAAEAGKLTASSTRSGTAASEDGPRWQSLKPAQREALAPLEGTWSALDATSKQRWLSIGGRFASMAPTERARIQGQMTDWSRLTPAERGQVRLRFQEAKQVPVTDRRKGWQDYQALPAEQKQQLAARAQRSASGVDTRGLAAGKSGMEGPQAKSNVVPNPALSAPPRSIAPALVQARPGATTTLLTKRAMPPSHQQTGMPKIAATPEFIDKSTLLPKRGAQAAGVGAIAPEPSATPH